MTEDKFVLKNFEELKALYIERNARYKDNHKDAGKVFMTMFGEMRITKDSEWGRLAIMFQIVGKMMRYRKMFYEVSPQCLKNEFESSQDCLRDIAVYANLLMELDNDEREKGKAEAEYEEFCSIID